MKNRDALKRFLDDKVNAYNNSTFIDADPISIPHQFTKQQDIEIMGFFAAILAWGQRKTIINKCNELVKLFGNAPHDFMLNHTDNDLKQLVDFKHRTFNATDLLYLVSFFKWYYSNNNSLEDAFAKHLKAEDKNVKLALIGFHNLVFSLPDAPHRTKKHIATPERKSACKRLNMYLRWMVRTDKNGVDFGIWKNISASQLICPLDVHVERVARKMGLITIKQSNWNAAEELTDNLKLLDQNDPVIYDYALFSLGVIEKY